MTAYYNEIDPYAAAWLRNLISAGHIAPGDVDERSIEDVRPDELRGYTQCHFFAGIGVWSYALRRAGWPDERPVWTGSCPCQPFSAAGKGGGFADERHLWPAFHHLIRECGPGVVFGEQVASKDGLAWLDLVQADLEGSAYASGAIDLCAAGVGAPHIRQRLRWCAERLADDASARRPRRLGETDRSGRLDWRGLQSHGSLPSGGVAYVDSARQLEYAERDGQPLAGREESARRHDDGGRGGFSRLADADFDQQPQHRPGRVSAEEEPNADRLRDCNGASSSGETGRPGPTNGLWRDADWLFCRDGKWRPVEPGTFPLAHGAASRVGRLRAYGNAIVAQAAEEFIGAYLDTETAVS